MKSILLTDDLRHLGYDANDIGARVRSGELLRLRRGAYQLAAVSDLQLTPETDHRRLVWATAPQLLPDSVISHGSAAVLHGLPAWSEQLRRVHVTRASQGARRRHFVETHRAPLRNEDFMFIDQVCTTTLPRTLLDIGRTWPYGRAVAAGDHALRDGLPRQSLLSQLDSMSGWPGIRQARRMIDFLDGAAETPGESLSRVAIADALLPAPQLQYEVRDIRG